MKGCRLARKMGPARMIHEGSWLSGGVARDKREERDARDV